MNKKKRTSLLWLVLATLAGVALIVFSNGDIKNKQEPSDTVSYYSQELERRVIELILCVEGVDRAAVLITLEDAGETVYAQDQLSASREYVLYTNSEGEEGLRLKEINPTVRGVAVVCTNGDNVTVKEKITSILSSALGIPTNRITVTG